MKKKKTKQLSLTHPGIFVEVDAKWSSCKTCPLYNLCYIVADVTDFTIEFPYGLWEKTEDNYEPIFSFHEVVEAHGVIFKETLYCLYIEGYGFFSRRVVRMLLDYDEYDIGDLAIVRIKDDGKIIKFYGGV